MRIAPPSEHPTVAGLKLAWREFPWRTVPEDPTGASGVAFRLWEVEYPDGLIDDLTDEEMQRTDDRFPYFAAIWPAAEALVRQA